MGAKWEAQRRLDYIDFRLLTAGSVRRADLARTFGISVPQASGDLNEFLRRYPGRMVYDKSDRRYVPGRRASTVRHNTPGGDCTYPGARRRPPPDGLGLNAKESPP